jgi:hypothetical protein
MVRLASIGGLLFLPAGSVLARVEVPALRTLPDCITGSDIQGNLIRLRTGGFWLNLHHFLYVLGRAEARFPDAGRSSVRGAMVDQDSVLSRLTDADRQIWRAAVRHYAEGPSRLDPIFDSTAFRMIHRLSRAESSAPISDLGLDPALGVVLEPAARIYREAWWPRHDAANRRRAASLQPLLDRHQDTLRAFVSRAYGIVWPGGGLDLHLSAYANWAGAYSTDGPLLVASSLDPALDGWHGVEMAVHEGLHQWDRQVQEMLAAAVRGSGVRPPGFDLVHGMIFATAGEAVRRIVPDHVEYAELHGLWRGRGMAPYAAAINTGWRPWLRGEATLDAALATLVRALP